MWRMLRMEISPTRKNRIEHVGDCPSGNLRDLLTTYARRYETRDFLEDDPSWFMHQPSNNGDREVVAFLSACLSYGRRDLFMPKIKSLIDLSEGNIVDWLANGRFREKVPDANMCFYRLQTHHNIRELLTALQDIISQYGSVGGLLREHSVDEGLRALELLTSFFNAYDTGGLVPRNTVSACKRLCMFLRWMVRDNSPVDLGLWASYIDKRSLIMPLDTHVVEESMALGLLSSRSTSMIAAKRLTAKMLEIFPNDPLRGDFALFGYGVDKKR